MESINYQNAGLIFGGVHYYPFYIDISSNQNNMSILNSDTGVTSSNLHLGNTSGSSKNITGIAAEENGHFLYIVNLSTNNVVLKNEDASSSASNRFTNISAADVTLTQYKTALYQYITTNSVNRWVQMF